MGRRVIAYSDVELTWVKANCELPRRELLAKFQLRFGRPELKVDDLKSLCQRRGWKTGRTGYFAKGSIPPNKGKKVPFNSQAVKTQFKAGSVPTNQKPMWSERICSKDGYVLIKVDMINPYTGYRGYFMAKQKYLWEQEHGPIPKGMVLRCLDGNKLNMDLGNWELITKALNARLNQRGYNDIPAELKPSALLSAKIVDKIGQLNSAGVTPCKATTP